MCGIFGWALRARACPGRDTLQRLTDLLIHRGPDSGGCDLRPTRDGAHHIAFGHRRLSIIDLSAAGHQPMLLDEGRFAVVFNGEIYNYIELRAELEAMGEVFETATDTEVLVRALKCWGTGALNRLRGMFAFALHDRAEDTILLARDPFGKKPLFLAPTPDGVYFASEVLPLIKAPGVGRTFNLAALTDYLRDRYIHGEQTFFTGVNKLPAGSYALWQNGSLTQTRYYTLPLGSITPDITDFEGACEEFRHLFDEAVRIRMRSDAPFGIFLSGGLDSTLTCGVMARHAGQPVRSFSVGFDEAEFSELAHARVAARHFGTDHREMTVSQAQMLEAWPEAILHRGAPVSEASDIPILLLSRAASRDVKMVLTGEGADEFFAGYPKYIAEHYLTRYRDVVPQGVHHWLLRPLVDLMPYGMRRLKVAAKALGIEDPADRARVWFGDISRKELDHWLLKAQSSPEDEVHFPDCVRSALRRCQYFDQTHWLTDNTLERNDRMMMSGSLEGRMPFMDREIAAFAARLPDGFLVRGFRGKAIVRAAMADLVPKDILRRRKNGFRVPINTWFRTAWRERMRELLNAPDARLRLLLNGAMIDRVVREHLDGQINHERILWSLANLEMFLRLYDIDVPDLRPTGSPP